MCRRTKKISLFDRVEQTITWSPEKNINGREITALTIKEVMASAKQ